MFRGQKELIKGKIVVTKNPCSHPGDVRLLSAISDPERVKALEHLINVVVFSCHGDRPEQHKMSGGDLDGDVYMCIWEPSILEHMEMNMIYAPAVYEKKTPDKSLLP
mmetsp:Transcript_45998/g.33761  ORF Transcript_45998/g.33761 Transcript_45998/m.33761 type:complete len:107 (-) Transcript_45998:1068-1388(-)